MHVTGFAPVHVPLWHASVCVHAFVSSHAVPFAFAKTSVPALTRGLGIASGLAALGFGCLLAYRVGFIDGLFTGSPHWTPR